MMATFNLSAYTDWSDAFTAMAAHADASVRLVVDTSKSIDVAAVLSPASAKIVSIVNNGFDTEVKVPGGIPFRIGNCERFTMKECPFYGTSGATYDANEVGFFFSDVKQAVVAQCGFYGIGVQGALGNIIRGYSTGLTIRECTFKATLHALSGVIGLQSPTMPSLIENCQFGDVHGVTQFPSKASTCHSWIHVFEGPPYPFNGGGAYGASGTGTVQIRNCGFDEQCKYAIYINNESGGDRRHHNVVIEDCHNYERSSNEPKMVYASRVEQLVVRRMRLFSNATTNAIDVANCGHVYAEDCQHIPGVGGVVPSIGVDANTRSFRYRRRDGALFTPGRGSAIALPFEYGNLAA
jgi:hypothetical protein